MNASNAQSVIETISNAFAGVPQPEEITLHVAEAQDNYDYAGAELHRKKDFRGPWQEVPEQHLENCQYALSYLDPVGFRFYLPAFMVWYLKNYQDPNKVKLDNTLYALDPYIDDQAMRKHKEELFALLTPQQLSACARFVSFLAHDATGMTDEDFAARIYLEHWHLFDSE